METHLFGFLLVFDLNGRQLPMLRGFNVGQSFLVLGMLSLQMHFVRPNLIAQRLLQSLNSCLGLNCERKNIKISKKID